MNNKVVLITGASSGLGFETALLLASKGYKVYATMRNLSKKDRILKEASNRNVKISVKQLDVTKSDSINQCVQEILEEENQIDILINNAGAGLFRTTEQATEEEIKWQLDVNLLGVIRCTKAILPSMRKNKSGRIINISSVAGLVGQPFNEFYSAAKFGVEGYTESLASYIQPIFNIKFTAIEPGVIKNEFLSKVFEQYEKGGGMFEDEYKPILERYINNGQNRRSDKGRTQTSEDVAQVILSCIEMEEPPVRMRTSEWGENLTKLKTLADPTGKIMQKKLAAFIK